MSPSYAKSNMNKVEKKGANSKKRKLESSIQQINRAKSLKNRLRSLQRLLSKASNETKGSDSVKSIQRDIEEVKHKIATKEKVQRERNNAIKYHKIKFFDRRKLMRLESKAKNLLRSVDTRSSNGEKNDKNNVGGDVMEESSEIIKARNDLVRIQTEQKYVAHYPNDTKYIPLFAKGLKRNVLDAKERKKMEAVCHRIAKEQGFSVETFRVLLSTEHGEDDVDRVSSGKVGRTNSSEYDEPNKTGVKDENINRFNVTSGDSRFNTQNLMSSKILAHLDDEDGNDSQKAKGGITEKNDTEISHYDDSDVSSDEDESDSDDNSTSGDNTSEDMDSGSDSDDSKSKEGNSKTSTNFTSTTPQFSKTKEEQNKEQVASEDENKSEDEDSAEDDFFAHDDVVNAFEDAAKASELSKFSKKRDKSAGWSTQKKTLSGGSFKKRRMRHTPITNKK